MQISLQIIYFQLSKNVQFCYWFLQKQRLQIFLNMIQTKRQRKQSLNKQASQSSKIPEKKEGRCKSTVNLVKRSSQTPQKFREETNYLIGWGSLQFGSPQQNYRKITSNVRDFSVGENHILILTNKKQALGIGKNHFGQLGVILTESNISVPKILLANSLISKVFCTPYSSFFLLQSGEVFAMGLNNRGQLGLGNNQNVQNPSKIEELSQISEAGISKRSSSKARIQSLCYQRQVLGDRTSLQENLTDVLTTQQHNSRSLLKNDEIVIDIKGGPFHTIALTSSGRLFYSGNIYKTTISNKNQCTHKFFELNTKAIGKIVSLKSGLTCFGMINQQGKLYLMGILSQNVICDEPAELPISNIVDFGISDKFLYTITRSGEVYVTDICKRQLKTTKIQLKQKIENVHCSLDYTIFLSQNDGVYGFGDNSDGFQFDNNNKIIAKPSLMNLKQFKISFSKISVSSRFVVGLLNKLPISREHTKQNLYQNNIQELEKQNSLLRSLIQKKQKKSTKIQTENQTKPLSEKVQSRTFDHNLQIPFNELTLQKHISEGGYGIIYKGTWRKTVVAVKIFKIDESNKNSVRDFISQCRAMEALRHPNIVMYLGACTKPPNFAIVLEYCEGGTLWSLLQSTTQLSWDQRKIFALDIAKGMNYLHDRNTPILHRDLKSLNILLDHSRRVKLADFGWTKGLQNYMTGKIGTYQWMAPQVISSQQYTQKADIFSFGIIMWEIASREPPYRNIPGVQVAHDVLNKQLRPPIPRKTPENFAGLMKKCWDKNPTNRPCFNQIIKELQQMKFS